MRTGSCLCLSSKPSPRRIQRLDAGRDSGERRSGLPASLLPPPPGVFRQNGPRRTPASLPDVWQRAPVLTRLTAGLDPDPRRRSSDARASAAPRCSKLMGFRPVYGGVRASICRRMPLISPSNRFEGFDAEYTLCHWSPAGLDGLRPGQGICGVAGNCGGGFGYGVDRIGLKRRFPASGSRTRLRTAAVLPASAGARRLVTRIASHSQFSGAPVPSRVNRAGEV